MPDIELLDEEKKAIKEREAENGRATLVHAPTGTPLMCI
jgi:hypothetical protein